MVVEDHVNFIGINPLIGPNSESIGHRFPSLFDLYDNQIMYSFITKGVKNGLVFRKGVLGFWPGPGFETRKELMFLQMNGIDLIGWSMVPEIITAAHAGMRTAGVCVVSDISDPLRARKVGIKEIEEAASRNQYKFAVSLIDVIKENQI